MSASLWSLLSVARAFFAGVLLLVPGVLTDLLALVIVLLPGRVVAPASHASMREAANDGVIEGEFHEIKDESPKLR